MIASWFPSSVSTPLTKTTILSASLIVDKRCAMTTVVMSPLFFLYASIASWTIFSLTLSSADVASSSSKIFGYLRKALAIATLYFWPPESEPPDPPTIVSSFLSIFWIKPQALAAIKASSISLSDASGLAYFIFSLIEALKRTGSWPT